MATSKTADKKGLRQSRPSKPTVIIPFTPTMPDVNLLPPRVFDAVEAAKARHRLAFAGGALVLVVAGGYLAQTAQIMVANKALDTETAKSAPLEKQVRTLTPFKVFYAGVSAQKATVQKTMAQELYFSQVASELSKMRAPGVSIDTLTIATSADTGASAATSSSCPPANPFTPAKIVTCVQFTGAAPKRENVAAFLVNLHKNPKFANIYIPVTDSGDEKPITFTGSVGITELFYTGRYAKDSWLLKDVAPK
jgi:hypothetical protein